MRNRKALLSFDNLITGCLLVLIFLFLNLTVADSTIATDFSGSGYYTLQKPTIDLLRGTDDLLKIKYHMSPKLAPPTPQYIDLKQRVTSLLRLYDEYGGANVRVEVTDPTDGARRGISNEVRDRLERNGIVPVVKKVQRQGKSTEYTFYSSIEITYRANTRTINKVTDVTNLEYLLSQEIQYAMNPELVQIGMYVPPKMTRSRQGRRRRRRRRNPGQRQRQEDTRSFSSLERKLKKIGVVERIFLEKGDHFPDPRDEDAIDVLLVLANRKIPDSDLYAIDQFLMRGGKVILAADPIGQKPSRRRSPLSRGGGERQGFLFSGESSGKTLLDLMEQYGVNGSSAVTIDQTEAEAQVPIRRQKTVTVQGQSQRVQMREFVWSDLPFLFKARPSRSRDRPAFIDRVGEPVVLFPMGLKPTDKKNLNYVPWFTTSDLGAELSAPSGPNMMGGGLGQFVQKAIDFSFFIGPSSEKTKKGKKSDKGGENASNRRRRPGLKMRDLVVSVRSTFNSAFKKDEIPEAMSGDGGGEKNGDADASSTGGKGGEQKGGESSKSGDKSKKSAGDAASSTSSNGDGPGKHIKKSPEQQLVVAGDTDLFKVSMMDRYRGRLFGERSTQSPNETFATGVVNYLTRSDKDELNIQSERVITPRLASFSSGTKTMFEVLLIGLAPLLVIVFGLFRWVLVRKRRNQVQLKQKQNTS